MLGVIMNIVTLVKPFNIANVVSATLFIKRLFFH